MSVKRVELNGTLTCPICGAGGYKNLAGHVYKHHQMTGADFKVKYNMPLVTSAHARLMAARSNALWSNPETRERRVEGVKASYSEGLRQQRSDAATAQWQDSDIRERRSEAISEATNVADYKRGPDKTNPLKILKQQLYKRADFKCESCGTTEEDEFRQTGRRLHLHHKNYDKTIAELDDVELLCANCHHSYHGDGRQRERFPMIARSVGNLLKALGVDLTDENFIETPRRFATFLLEHFTDGSEFELALETFKESVFTSEYDGMILQNFSAVGMCPHHLLPVMYSGVIGYIPQEKTIGLSKLSRMAELCLHNPILQEFATLLLADTVSDVVETEHVAVLLRGQHTCMSIRGVKAHKSFTITSELKGLFYDTAARSEFLSLAKTALKHGEQ